MDNNQTPSEEEVQEAAKVIQDFCLARTSDPETDCIECPIKDICGNDPYLWDL